ncbi:hypothetical protein Taro_053945 [Colocasia esculenta]|uniref:Uncharacterized protein n=1 Tax=Colocasia esculenta TaxID=4460 RepID=A0A843XPL4_COLES|nr:hypothetical protein [Colocasia esculenta]
MKSRQFLTRLGSLRTTAPAAARRGCSLRLRCRSRRGPSSPLRPHWNIPPRGCHRLSADKLRGEDVSDSLSISFQENVESCYGPCVSASRSLPSKI